MWRTLIGETAIELRAADGVVRVGAANDSATVSVTLRATDVRRFADDLSRRLAVRRPRDSTWTIRLEEPGVSAGALSISPGPRAPDKTRRYALFVSDEVLTAVQQQLTATEASILGRKLRQAATAALPRRTAPRRPAAKRPAGASG